MQEVIYAILFVEAEIIGLFIALFVIVSIWDWVDKKLNPHYPYCDIDPRCHIAFTRDKDGNGWVGNHLVLPNDQE